MKKIVCILFSCLVGLNFAFIYSYASDAADIPQKYSAAEAGYVTEPKNQGLTLSCWAFAAMSCLETDAVIQGYEAVDEVDFSEAHLVWATYTTSQIEKDINKDEAVRMTARSPYECGGEVISAVSTLSKGCGINNESEFPFSPYKLDEMGNYSSESFYSNNGYSLGEAAYLKTGDEIKNWILDHGSVAVMVKSESSREKYGYNIYNPEAETVTHAVTIVGWDNEYPKENFVNEPENNGAWLCKNSYGTAFGENGYCWLSYEDKSASNACGLTIEKTNYDTVHTYNGVPYVQYMNVRSGLKFANIYKTENNETLKQISFYTVRNEHVNIKVIKLNEGYANPEDGECIYNEPYEYEFNGYHIVKTDNVILESDSTYSVIIEMTGEKCTCVTEKSSSYTNYTSAPGQSYLYAAGEWKDIYEDGNAYVNLYTEQIKQNKTIFDKIIEFFKMIVEFFENLIHGSHAYYCHQNKTQNSQ